jgi:hypothetical protein
MGVCMAGVTPRKQAQRRRRGSIDPPAERRVGAGNSVTSCDLHVLVCEATESISSQWPCLIRRTDVPVG